MNTLADRWSSFEEACFAGDVPEAAIQIARRTFYAGAFSVLYLQECAVDNTEDAFIAMQQTWLEECLEFFNLAAPGIEKGKPA